MTPPTNVQSWESGKRQYPVGTVVTGRVLLVAEFGVFVELVGGVAGLLLVPEMEGDGPRLMESYPQVGETVTARVLWHNDRDRKMSLTQRVPNVTG